MDTDYIVKRDLYKKIKKHLDKKEITIISGLRQTGKSTILKKIKKDLKKKKEKTIFLNFDFDADKKFLRTQEALLNKIKFEFGKSKGYVFIDEIQRRENAGLYLKGLYDLGLPYKFIVSGSGSIELKEKIQESLMGRKRIFELLPISFIEFINFKTNYKYSDRLDSFFKLEKEKTNNFLNEYLNFGGMPRLVTEKDTEEKIEIINEIYNSYITRDLVDLLKINNTALFKNVFKNLANLSGQLINYTNIANNINTSTETLKKYLYFAEKTYSIKTITPYFNNITKELRKSPMIYYTDLGIMNYAIGKFGNLTNSMDFGFVFQNFIFNILREKVARNMDIKYWRTTDKAEVDFVIDKITDVVPIEIKYKNLRRNTISRSFRSFIDKYKPKNAYLINLSLDTKIIINKTTVHIIPYAKLITDVQF